MVFPLVSLEATKTTGTLKKDTAIFLGLRSTLLGRSCFRVSLPCLREQG